jgi:hypothetical protein
MPFQHYAEAALAVSSRRTCAAGFFLLQNKKKSYIYVEGAPDWRRWGNCLA